MSVFTTAYAVAILGGACAFLGWIDSPQVRHAFVGLDAQCSVNQFTKLPAEQVDLIAIGSSRVRAGMDLSIVATLSEGAVVSPYNFARTGMNPLRNFVMFRDLLEKGISPGFAYVEVSTEAFVDNENNRRIQPFSDVGILKFEDILKLFDAYKHASLLQRLHIVGASVLKKVSDTLIYVANGQILEANSGLTETSPRVCWYASYDEKTESKDAAIARGKVDYENMFGDLSVAENDSVTSFSTPSADLELYSFDLIRSLAKSHGIKLVSSRHWAAYEPPLSDHSLHLLRERIPEFIYPSQSFVRSTWSGFVDATHMYKHARKRFSEWLAAQFFEPGANR